MIVKVTCKKCGRSRNVDVGDGTHILDAGAEADIAKWKGYRLKPADVLTARGTCPDCVAKRGTN